MVGASRLGMFSGLVGQSWPEHTLDAPLSARSSDDMEENVAKRVLFCVFEIPCGAALSSGLFWRFGMAAGCLDTAGCTVCVEKNGIGVLWTQSHSIRTQRYVQMSMLNPQDCPWP